MKKILMQFADSLLSKEQMKFVKGGYDDGTSCPQGETKYTNCSYSVEGGTSTNAGTICATSLQNAVNKLSDTLRTQLGSGVGFACGC